MNKYSLIFILILTLQSNYVVHAQEKPYNFSWQNETAISGVSSLVFIGGFFLDKSVANSESELDISHLNRLDVNSFDRSATYKYNEHSALMSDIGIATMVIAPSLLLLDNQMHNDAMGLILMYAQTMMLSGGSALISKGLIERHRPFVYNENAPINDKLNSDAKKSYFSGHSSISFASAAFLSTVYSTYYPDSKYKTIVISSSFLAAATVAYLRYDAGKHFPTDILTGAIIGTAFGYLVPYLHQEGKDLGLGTSTNKPFVISFTYKF